MSKLDIETLKQCRRVLLGKVPANEHDHRRAWDLLFDSVPAIIAALEDRDRLRAAAQGMHEVLGRFFDATHHAAGDHLDWEGATLADLLEPYQELRSVLFALEAK